MGLAAMNAFLKASALLCAVLVVVGSLFMVANGDYAYIVVAVLGTIEAEIILQ